MPETDPRGNLRVDHGPCRHMHETLRPKPRPSRNPIAHRHCGFRHRHVCGTRQHAGDRRSFRLRRWADPAPCYASEAVASGCQARGRAPAGREGAGRGRGRSCGRYRDPGPQHDGAQGEHALDWVRIAAQGPRWRRGASERFAAAALNPVALDPQRHPSLGCNAAKPIAPECRRSRRS